MMEALERQFLILCNRSQVAMGLTGIIVTTRGFSGRLIAGTNRLAQVLIILGVTMAMISALVVVLGGAASSPAHAAARRTPSAAPLALRSKNCSKADPHLFRAQPAALGFDLCRSP